MCASYHEGLNGLLDSLRHMAVLIEVIVSEATTSPLEPDLARAEAIISSDSQLDAMHRELKCRCLSLLAFQAPVVGELRTIVFAVQVTFELTRMGDLTIHIAKIARLHFPDPTTLDSLQENFSRMSEVCVAIVQLANQSLKDHDAVAAPRMAEVDREMDHLRHDHFDVLLGRDWPGSVEQATDVVLLGRHFERFTDHAAAVARRVIYIITGQFPEGEGWLNA